MKNTDALRSKKKPSKLAASPRAPFSDRIHALNSPDPNKTQANDNPSAHPMEIDDIEMDSESIREEADAAAEALDQVEENTKEAYEEYMTCLRCLKIAQQVVTTALAAAKAAKENYKRVQISIYHEVYLSAEKKAATATLRSQQAGKELEKIQDRLRELLVT